jgi:hypothetical protein
MKQKNSDRRQFLKNAAAAVLAGSGVANLSAQAKETANPIQLENAKDGTNDWHLDHVDLV